jgi:hypothetical protein
MKNATRIAASVAATILFAACSSGGLPGSVRTVSVAQGTRHTPQVLAPANSRYFSGVAESRSSHIAGELRLAIANELADSQRFQLRASGPVDAEIAIEHLRHGLVEVADGMYAVNISGSAAINRHGFGNAAAGRAASRDFSGTSGVVRSLADFENAANYDQAARAVVEKIAVELVAGL